MTATTLTKWVCLCFFVSVLVTSLAVSSASARKLVHAETLQSFGSQQEPNASTDREKEEAYGSDNNGSAAETEYADRYVDIEDHESEQVDSSLYEPDQEEQFEMKDSANAIKQTMFDFSSESEPASKNVDKYKQNLGEQFDSSLYEPDQEEQFEHKNVDHEQDQEEGSSDSANAMKQAAGMPIH